MIAYAVGAQIEHVASGNVGTITGPPTAKGDYPVDFRGFSTHVNVIGLRKVGQ